MEKNWSKFSVVCPFPCEVTHLKPPNGIETIRNTIGLALSSVEMNVYNVDLCLARRAEEVSQEIPENIALKVLQIRMRSIIWEQYI